MYNYDKWKSLKISSLAVYFPQELFDRTSTLLSARPQRTLHGRLKAGLPRLSHLLRFSWHDGISHGIVTEVYRSHPGLDSTRSPHRQHEGYWKEQLIYNQAGSSRQLMKWAAVEVAKVLTQKGCILPLSLETGLDQSKSFWCQMGGPWTMLRQDSKLRITIHKPDQRIKRLKTLS